MSSLLPIDRSEKSTNVRTENKPDLPAALKAQRLGFRILGLGAPALAGRMAERLFYTARRFPRPAWEHEILDRARHVFVPHRHGLLPVWTWGQGPLVLLVHGWEGRGAQLGKMVDPLVEAGFQVVTFDGPGHGDTRMARASVPDLADAIASVVREIGTPHAIVAHSVGALATTYALTRGVTSQRVVLVAPATDPRDYTRAFARIFDLSDDVRDDMVARVEARFGIAIESLYGPHLAARLEMPMHVFHDVSDREVTVDHGRRMALAWRGAAMTETAGLGHRRILRDPAVIAGTVAFVRGHAADTVPAVVAQDENPLASLGFARDE